MKTEEDQIGKTEILRATISIITRGGPLRINVGQDTNPVLLKGMQLPAEARYNFKDPTDHSSNFVNHTISIELFFGDNGKEEFDMSLGNFQLQEFLPHLTSSRNIDLRLAVSHAQIISLTLLDSRQKKSLNIGFIDISALDPPVIKPMPKIDASDNIKNTFSNIMEMVENPQPRQTGIPRRGEDLVQDVTISFDEALQGCSKDIKVVGTETCPACSGSGTVSERVLSSCPDCMGTGWAKEIKETSEGPQYHFTACTTCKGDGLVNIYPCHTCQGNGWVMIKRPFTLHIPAYIDSGGVICVLHQGKPGQFGGLPGHLRIIVNILPHAFLTRSGQDICVDLPVSTKMAQQGGHIRVPALEKGRSFLRDLPAGTRNNAIFRVTENKAYSLSARIETYRPAFLFMRPSINQRIQAINEWLERETDTKMPTTDKSDPDEGISTTTVPAMAVSTTLALERSTKQAKFYTRRGMIYKEKGDREHSLADFNMAIELDPEYASAYDHRSLLYMSQEEPGKAMADVNRALELAPNNAEYYYHRGLLYHFQKDLAKTLADYTKALELDSINAEIYEIRGKAFMLQNDLEAALVDFNKALELDPTRVDCYHQRGILYQLKNALAKTITDFTKALELDPDNDSVRADRGQVYAQLNNLENALSDANILVEKNPRNARAYNNRGYVYSLQSDSAKALADYDRALELDPNLFYTYNNRGNFYLKLACYEQAIEDFNKSLVLHPGDSWLYLWIGQAYQGLGNKKKAIEYYQKVLHTSQISGLCQEAQKLLSDLG
jgi:tetratricopeptide (TPR) repeat protein